MELSTSVARHDVSSHVKDFATYNEYRERKERGRVKVHAAPQTEPVEGDVVQRVRSHARNAYSRYRRPVPLGLNKQLSLSQLGASNIEMMLKVGTKIFVTA